MEAVKCRCGSVLGSKIPIFDLIKSELIRQSSESKMKGVKPMYITMEDLGIELGSLMDILRINLECCRAEMLSKRIASDVSIV